jgi:hypothetical protein
MFELGDGKLTPEEQSKICAALQVEANRLQSLATTINIEQLTPGGHAA